MSSQPGFQFQQPPPQLPFPATIPNPYNMVSKPQPSISALETHFVARKSSPISIMLDDWQILTRFFESKILGQPPEVADKWLRVKRIVGDQD